ncbi:MAG: SRPBCC family protein [Candidatus Acidiferrales bacterium]
MATPSIAPEVVEVRRTFTAPREKVFQAWIDPKMMSKWFARGTKMPPAKVLKADVRPGGEYHVQVTCPPNDTIYELHGSYKEVRPPERLVFTWWFEALDFRDSVVTVEFRELGQSGFTELHLKHELLPESQRKDHLEGWQDCLQSLEWTLQGKEF